MFTCQVICLAFKPTGATNLVCLCHLTQGAKRNTILRLFLCLPAQVEEQLHAIVKAVKGGCKNEAKKIQDLTLVLMKAQRKELVVNVLS